LTRAHTHTHIHAHTHMHTHTRTHTHTQRFVESVPLSMEHAWMESHSKCPLICLLSAGADPTKLIEDLAKKKKIKTMGVSMGQVGVIVCVCLCVDQNMGVSMGQVGVGGGVCV